MLSDNKVSFFNDRNYTLNDILPFKLVCKILNGIKKELCDKPNGLLVYIL